jgi:hypothetical protein
VATRRRGPQGFSAPVPPPPPPPRIDRQGQVAPATGLQAAARDGLGFANLALGPKARAAASSVLPGHVIHQVAHLNDGRLGNAHSWISASDPSWAEVDLGEIYWVWKVAFGSDSSRQHSDRAATGFSILAAIERSEEPKAVSWRVVLRRAGGEPVRVREEFAFRPVQARWVRVAIEATNSGTQARIDELEVFGQKEPIALERIGPLPEPAVARPKAEAEGLLRDTFLGEEHAWLKTFGRADLSPRLVPYNGRVKEYPRHVGDDHLPLPPLSAAPTLDGRLDEPCWGEASRGTARVGRPDDFARGPLVTCAAWAGRRGDDLFLAVQTDRLLSAHVAVVSTADGQGCGVVAVEGDGLVFRACQRAGKGAAEPARIDGAFDASLTRFEMRLPLAWFPEVGERGLRVGLGMGGRHTRSEGRPVHFVVSPLALAEAAPCAGGVFHVRLRAAEPLRVRADAPGLEDGLALAAGQTRVLALPAERGPIGPELRLSVEEEGGEAHTLHLFRYDPLERTLALMQGLVERLAAKGLDVEAERAQLARFRSRQERLLAAAADREAEREAYLEARVAKRRLFLREPDLAAAREILFVKRHPFHPSHNYSVLLDSAYRGGGGVYVLRIPLREGRLEPGEAEAVRLFDAGGGIARTPMASFDLAKVYFAHRPSREGFYHVLRMNADGSGLEQLTDGPWHDYWPCPLPDGGIAFITTRCKARYLCWRPQAAILFRMDADGRGLRPLSHANLSEWAPSVMADGRILWTRSEYIDKGADFSHTLWAIRPDGTQPELVFGNAIIQPNGYANGREVPGTREICCTLISHFGDLNGPIALVDLAKGRFNPQAITSLTPEVPWPGMWPMTECFRDPVPIARDYVLCAHAPAERFGLYLIDRFGNREMLHLDPAIGSVCPTPFRKVAPPPAVPSVAQEPAEEEAGQFVLMDVYQGLEPAVERGRVKYLRVCEEVRSSLERLPSGEYRRDHPEFLLWYASPVDKVSGPSGWPSYVAKGTHGLVPVEADGSAAFTAPAGKVLYFTALDADFNELQRMRSVVQLQPGERRSCIGCHESRGAAPPVRVPLAFGRPPWRLEPPPWGAGPLDYERVVQPVWDAQCVRCHNATEKNKIDLSGTLDDDRIPTSYRSLIRGGWVHYLDCGWNSGGNEKRPPLSFGTLKSKLWPLLDRGHHGVQLTLGEKRRVKCWTDLNCPLWPDYVYRPDRPKPPRKVSLQP